MQRQLKALRYYWRYFAPYRRRAVLVVVLSITYSLLEALGIAALLPVIEQAVGSGESSPVTSLLQNVFAAVGLPFRLETVLAIVVVFFLAKCVAEYYSIYLSWQLSKSYMLGTMTRLFHGYSNARWEFFVRQRIGYLLNVISEVRTNGNLIRQGMQQVSNVIFTLVLLVTSFVISPQLTGFALAFLGVSLAAVLYAVPRVKRLGAGILSGTEVLSTVITQYLLGYKTMKAYNAFGAARETVDRVAMQRERAQIRVARFDAALATLPEVLLLVTLVGSVYLSLSLTSGIGELGVVIALLVRVSQRAKQLRAVATLGEYLPSVRLVARTLEDFRRHGTSSRARRDSTPMTFQRAIAFEDVSFTYAGERRTAAIADLDLTIRKGEFIGIVGPSGAGKSTLSGLLLGLLEPTSGTIAVDGRPLGDATPEAWLDLIGYVPQESFLLNATVAENIAFFRAADEEQVVRAARLAHIHQFVASLPVGYQTRVGENGVELSGGERQRVCLARALMGDPQILVLDEATSSLDSASERAIQEAIADLPATVTVVMIAHRLSTVADADRILVLEGGRLVESGAPRELLDREGGVFRRMYELQTGSSRAL